MGAFNAFQFAEFSRLDRLRRHLTFFTASRRLVNEAALGQS